MTVEAALVRLNAHDAPLCAALHRSCFACAEQWSTEAFDALLSTSTTIGWCVKYADKPVGLLLLRYCGDEAEILTLAVHPDYRRRGVAGSMVGTACLFSKSKMIKVLFLEVSVHNQSALALYLKQGFSLCGHRKAYYSDGSDASVLRYDFLNEIR